MIAFTGDYNGNVEVYIVAATGGTPHRLTYHPAEDRVCGWKPDGSAILFRSAREINRSFDHLYTVRLDGGAEQELPLGRAECGSFSPNGRNIAYASMPVEATWKDYRGGRISKIRIAQLATGATETLPNGGGNNFAPIWIGERIYFLSDRSRSVDLFEYDISNGKTSVVVRAADFDLKAVSAGPGGIVFEQFGSLWFYDTEARVKRRIPIQFTTDFAEMRSKMIEVSFQVGRGRISPDGTRVLFEARGDLFLVEKGQKTAANMTQTPGSREREAAWSPDGTRIAYFSDESGEYALYVRDAGPPMSSTVKKYSLGQKPGFPDEPMWSPDGHSIAYRDQALRFWYLDLDTGRSDLVDADSFQGRREQRTPTWSPDSRFLAYAKTEVNKLRAVYVYSVKTGRAERVSGALIDATNPVFDGEGDLYFTAVTAISTPVGNEMDLGGALRLVFKVARDKRSDLKDAIPYSTTKARPLALPARVYTSIEPGPDQALFLSYEVGTSGSHTYALVRWNKEIESLQGVADAVMGYDVSFGGRYVLLFRRENGAPKWSVVDIEEAKPTEDLLSFSAVMDVVPPEEWHQIFVEALRFERDFFFAPAMRDVDVYDLQKRYAPFLAGLRSRADLNYLLAEIVSHFHSSHLFVEGGDIPRANDSSAIGLLGCDFSIESGRYRIARILSRSSWHPAARSPLGDLDGAVREGDFVIALNGRALTSADSIGQRLLSLAGRTVKMTVSDSPSDGNIREVSVTPIDSDYSLRVGAWIDENRRIVDRATNGRVAYVYVANTTDKGFQQFVLQLLEKAGKEGVIVDARDNSGGALADSFNCKTGEILAREITS